MMPQCIKMCLILTTLNICNTLVTSKTQPILAETKYGFVVGSANVSRSERTYYAFKGIPYAKPPVNELRFRPPQDPDTWSYIYDARKNPPRCLQKNYLFANPQTEGSEDCLYINVYTPNFAARKNSSYLLPVMVFIHWGGFFAGYSGSDYLGPEYFMDKDVVLVTFNYRLGVLGFFSTNDDSAPGNYGLKDQVAALKWVQDNIGNFGGNKSKVTIFGQSAGAASVHYHLFSKQSRSLFHQAISMSGTALALWAKPFGKEQLVIANAQAKLVGCDASLSTEDIVDCMRQVNAEDLVASGDNFKYFSIDPLNVYQPTIEKESELNRHPFITKSPIEHIRDNDFANVPWIIGIVNNEGLIRAEPLLRQSETRKYLSEHFDDIMPNLMALTLSSRPENMSSIWSEIKKFYFNSKQGIDVSDKMDIKGFIDLYTDRSFAYSSYQSALIHKVKGHENLWFYHFNYTGEYSYGDLFAATTNNINYDWGVSHCDDLIYLFKSPALIPELTSHNDLHMSKIMVEMWTNFAIYGNPTPKNRNWEKVETSYNNKLKHLCLEGDYKDSRPPKRSIKLEILENRMNFWENLPLSENIEELNQTVAIL